MKNIQSIVFFGTHELAVPALDTLSELEATPRLIVTHPKAGYVPDGEESPHPVVDWAQEHGVDLVRSSYAMEPDLRQRITELEPDLMVVVDYGQPLPAELLEAVEGGAIEVHPSKLPDLRGAHALRASIAAGLKASAVTVIDVNEDPWAGPVLLLEELTIGERDTFGDLFPRARDLCCKLLGKALKKLDRAKKRPRGKPQKDPAKSLPAPDIGGRHRKAPWSLKGEQVYNRLRAYAPSGLKAYFRYRPIEIVSGMPMAWVEAPFGSSGTYLGMRQGKLAVLCGESTIFGISRIRLPDGETVGAGEFAFKEKLQVGDRFA